VSDYGKPSLNAELEAVSIISQYLGDGGRVDHKGKECPWDFEIHYNDSRVAIGEVSILEEEDYRSWIDAYSKLENNYLIPLPPGFGAWADWPMDDISTKARNLGISYINKAEYLNGDILMWGSEGSGGVIQDEVEPLVAEIEKLLHGGNFQTSWTKLMPYPADEKHIFFKCGSLISNFLLDCLRPTNDRPLTADFTFPEGITHFWLTSGLQNSATLLWISDGQKEKLHINVPPLCPEN